MSEFLESDIIFSEQTMKTVFWFGNQIPGGFFIYRADDTQEIIYVNRAAFEIFGCADLDEFKTLTGNTFRGIVHPDDYVNIQASIDRQIEEDNLGKLDYVEYRIIRKDGEVRWVDDYGHYAELPGYGEVYYVFITDVTDKHHAREEKLRARLELAREKQHNEVKAGFLFNMSHDIRTPMNSIVGYSELARRHKDDPELLSEYLDKIITSGQLMLTLLDDMLETNSLAGNRVQLRIEPTLIREQLAMTVDLFRMEAEKKLIRLEEDIDLPEQLVLADQNRFCRIIGNLISNAIKFTHPGGNVTLRARQIQELQDGTGMYEFQVIDNGVGISEDFTGRIFDAFERENSSTTTGMSGTGLGLTIVKSLLDLMDGTIRVSSKKGEGSVFTVELPFAAADTAAAEDAGEGEVKEADPDEGKHRILIVEDIELNRELVVALLKEYGFLTEAVEDGHLAVGAFETHPVGYYDLILMDIQMPVMNGYDAARAIRALPRPDAQTIPIIALSANAREEDKQMSLESGMNSHVAKPFDIAPLVSLINEYLIR
ncbi:MAG: response regulator [Anaerolineaceae bacterium]|nr:response regulator [Anaerolineaceae bacterium]